MTGPVYSDDGNWMWNGTEWIPATTPEQVVPASAIEPAMVEEAAQQVGVSPEQVAQVAPHFDLNQDTIIDSSEMQQAAASVANPVNLAAPDGSQFPPQQAMPGGPMGAPMADQMAAAPPQQAMPGGPMGAPMADQMAAAPPQQAMPGGPMGVPMADQMAAAPLQQAMPGGPMGAPMGGMAAPQQGLPGGPMGGPAPQYGMQGNPMGGPMGGPMAPPGGSSGGGSKIVIIAIAVLVVVGGIGGGVWFFVLSGPSEPDGGYVYWNGTGSTGFIGQFDQASGKFNLPIAEKGSAECDALNGTMFSAYTKKNITIADKTYCAYEVANYTVNDDNNELCLNSVCNHLNSGKKGSFFLTDQAGSCSAMIPVSAFDGFVFDLEDKYWGEAGDGDTIGRGIWDADKCHSSATSY